MQNKICFGARVIALLHFLLGGLVVNGEQVFATRMGPAFPPSVPSSASGAFTYRYIFSGDSIAAPGTCQQSVWIQTLTYEFASTAAGQVLRDRDAYAYKGISSYLCAFSFGTFEGQASRNLGNYSPNYQAYLDVTGFYHQNINFTNKGADEAQANRMLISGPGYSGYIDKAGGTDYFFHSGYCCMQNWAMRGTSGYLEIYLQVEQGAAPPSISQLIGANPCVNVEYGPADRPIVGVVKIYDSWDYYYGPWTISGSYRITRSGCDLSSALTVAFSLTGTATSPCSGLSSKDYDLRIGGVVGCINSVTIPANATFVDIWIDPVYDPYFQDPTEYATLTVLPSSLYSVDSFQTSATLPIFDTRK